MNILGVHPGYHEASACLFDEYRMVAAVALERLTRLKIDGGRVPNEAIEECLDIAGLNRQDIDVVVLGRGTFPWRYFNHFRGGRLIEGKIRQALGAEKHKSMERELVRSGHADSESIFNTARFLRDFGFRADVQVRFFNHHLAHALPTLFHTTWNDALLYTADGGGDNVQYSHRIFKDDALTTLFGGDEEFARPMRVDSLGLAYGFATQSLGFKINRHEGKLTGLAAYGEPRARADIGDHFQVREDGQIISDFADNGAMRDFMFSVAERLSREDVASSIQAVLEDKITEAVTRLMALHEVRHLGLAGGVFGNVRLNQRLAEATNAEDVFIYPAMSDQGLPAGGVLQFLLERDGMPLWLQNRAPLDAIYLGRDFGADIDRTFEINSKIQQVPGDVAETAATLLQNGKAVALYTHGMEYGPRALGARSILASPADASINDSLNERLSRSEFMPFAPVVAEEDANTVFHLDAPKIYASRFMTITCDVRPEWRDKIPAVVHVDGTARPQVIKRDTNPMYFDILKAFQAASGLPVMINTSFNVHEEPIINRPEECLRALLDGRVDAVATDLGVYVLADA